MTGRPRTRPTTPADCDCHIKKHVHGTAAMYQDHRCGCTTCSHAYAEYRAKRRGYSEQTPAPFDGPIEGLFIATFPYYGGLSPQRLRRILRAEVAALAEAQGVDLLPGDPVVRVDRTGAGAFVVVRHPGVSARPLAEVRRRAGQMAYEHEQAHPSLARWINEHLKGVAA